MRPHGVQLVPVGDVDALTRAILTQLMAPRRAHANERRPQRDTAGEENLEATLRLYRELVGSG